MDKLKKGQHSIQFKKAEKKKPNLASDLGPNAGSAALNEWDMYGPGPTGPTSREASRKGRDGNPINYKESGVHINHDLTQAGGGKNTSSA